MKIELPGGLLDATEDDWLMERKSSPSSENNPPPPLFAFSLFVSEGAFFSTVWSLCKFNV